MYNNTEKYRPLVVFFLLSYLFAAPLALPTISGNHHLIDLDKYQNQIELITHFQNLKSGKHHEINQISQTNPHNINYAVSFDDSAVSTDQPND